MPSMPGGDDKKEDDKAPETPEAKAEREQQVGCEEKENENRKVCRGAKNNPELRNSSS